MATNLQKHLDSIYDKRSATWERELRTLDFTGDFNITDADEFLKATTGKNLASWAVSVELKTRHSALKKIIDSL